MQCHSVNDDTAQFCDQCGTKMMPKGYVSNMAGVEDMTQAWRLVEVEQRGREVLRAVR